mmetsp:Transcript_13299/g.24585  ORF Transcript_13299/g.24585 Transcript_13299/m.24585 type:complete len:81 (+) Transcript_13299:105-347(+)
METLLTSSSEPVLGAEKADEQPSPAAPVSTPAAAVAAVSRPSASISVSVSVYDAARFLRLHLAAGHEYPGVDFGGVYDLE